MRLLYNTDGGVLVHRGGPHLCHSPNACLPVPNGRHIRRQNNITTVYYGMGRTNNDGFK